MASEFDSLRQKFRPKFDPGLYQLRSEKGQPRGYASLGRDGKVPASQLPEDVDTTTVAGIALAGGGVLEWVDGDRLQFRPKDGETVARVPVQSSTGVWLSVEVTNALTWNRSVAGAGGMQPGTTAQANTGYEIRIVTKTGGTAAALLGTENGAEVSLPTAYTHASPVLGFASLTDGGSEDEIREFRQSGDYFWYDYPDPGGAHVGITVFEHLRATTNTALDLSAYLPAAAIEATFWGSYVNDSTTVRSYYALDADGVKRFEFRAGRDTQAYEIVAQGTFVTPLFGDPTSDVRYKNDPSAPAVGEGLDLGIIGFRLDMSSWPITLVGEGGAGTVTSVTATAPVVSTGGTDPVISLESTSASKLFGRGSGGGAGNAELITLGTNLSMSGTTLNATGGGGGGDAATLDGLDSTQFLRSDTSDSFTSGTLTMGAGTTLDNAGNAVKTDAIVEHTLNAGVTVEGVAIEDGVLHATNDILSDTFVQGDAFIALDAIPVSQYRAAGIVRDSASPVSIDITNPSGTMTLEVQGNTVWHAGNDGTGSGLDADLVDGKNPGSANGIATLNGSSLVVENPANATATPTASKIPIADGSGLLDGWVTNVPDSTYYRGGNMTLNWPIITGQTTVPEWWNDEAQITTTVSTCTTESITRKIDERIFKHVTSGSGSGAAAYQRLTVADHQGYAISEPLSCSRWVYQTGSNTITLELKDSTGATLGSATTTASATWTLLKVNNVTPTGGSTYVDQRVKVNANSATFFSTAPMLHIGTAAKPFERNPLEFVEAYDDTVDTDPADTSGHTQSFASVTHPLACILQLTALAQGTGAGQTVAVLPAYSSVSTALDSTHIVRTVSASTIPAVASKLVHCDDTQQITWTAGNANISTLRISLSGYWRFTY